MLTITLDSTGKKLNISSAYLYKNRIKALPTATFNFDIKKWQISIKSLDALCEAFKGELYFKTPLWKLKGEKAPDYSKLYEIHNNISVPETKLPLYDYQKFGAKFLIDRVLDNKFAILSDGVGIGKTGQSIAAMQWFAENKNAKRFLLIVKKSIKYQWMEEIKKFTNFFDDFDVFITGDTKKKRLKAYEGAITSDKCILITNYHNFLNDIELISPYKFDIALIDEAHCVKSHESKINNGIGSIIKGKNTIFLTGTPILSKPEDIFGIIHMSNPNYFEEWKDFKKKYLVQEYNYGYTATVGAKCLDELRDKVQNIVLRRTENEISIEMPETIEKFIDVEPDEVQLKLLQVLTDDEKRIKEQYDLVAKTPDSPEKSENLLKLSSKLKAYIAIKQAAATDPNIFKLASSKIMKHYSQYLPEKNPMTPKSEAILDIIEEIVESGEKVIIFSKFVTVGLYYEELLKKLKIKSLKYTGKEDDKTRVNNINLFRNSDEYNVLIGTDAMAEGLNLAEARHVINIDLPDTYAIYTQRLGRARRVSSTYDNIVVHNIMTLNTVDQARKEKLIKDKTLDAALVGMDEAQSMQLAKISNG